MTRDCQFNVQAETASGAGMMLGVRGRDAPCIVECPRLASRTKATAAVRVLLNGHRVFDVRS